MKKYRIIKKTYLDGSVYYRVQERIFYFFWGNVEMDEVFYAHRSLINVLNMHERHPANLVGRRHSEYIDALEEVAYHESCDKSRKVIKAEIIKLNG